MIEQSLSVIVFSQAFEINFSGITEGKHPFLYLWLPLSYLTLLATSYICLSQGSCEPQGNEFKWCETCFKAELIGKYAQIGNITAVRKPLTDTIPHRFFLFVVLIQCIKVSRILLSPNLEWLNPHPIRFRFLLAWSGWQGIPKPPAHSDAEPHAVFPLDSHITFILLLQELHSLIINGQTPQKDLEPTPIISTLLILT